MAFKLFCREGKVIVLSDETPCNLVERYQRFVTACCSISRIHRFFSRNLIKGYDVLKLNNIYNQLDAAIINLLIISISSTCFGR